MRGLMIAFLALGLLAGLACIPAAAKADCGAGGCGAFGNGRPVRGVLRRAGGGLKRVLGVERRQARRAARRG